MKCPFVMLMTCCPPDQGKLGPEASQHSSWFGKPTVKAPALSLGGNIEKEVEMVENSHHTITIPVLRTCRICGPDEEEQDDVLVELGCDCKDELSRMHRKCILEWYGTRMLLQNNCKCEICKALLHTKTQAVVVEAVSDHENGGRAILMAALKSQLAPFVWMRDIESAANFEELVELLMATKAEVLRRMELETGEWNGENGMATKAEVLRRMEWRDQCCKCEES